MRIAVLQRVCLASQAFSLLVPHAISMCGVCHVTVLSHFHHTFPGKEGGCTCSGEFMGVSLIVFMGGARCSVGAWNCVVWDTGLVWYCERSSLLCLGIGCVVWWLVVWMVWFPVLRYSVSLFSACLW